MSVLTDLRNRGVKDVFFVCDGLKGLPEVVSNVWPEAIVQTCIIHLIRNTFRLTSRKYWDEINATSNRSTPRSTPPQRAQPSTSWPKSGGSATRRWSGSGTTPGASSSRFGLRRGDPPGHLLDEFDCHSTPATDERSRRAGT